MSKLDLAIAIFYASNVMSITDLISICDVYLASNSIDDLEKDLNDVAKKRLGNQIVLWKLFYGKSVHMYFFKDIEVSKNIAMNMPYNSYTDEFWWNYIMVTDGKYAWYRKNVPDMLHKYMASNGIVDRKIAILAVKHCKRYYNHLHRIFRYLPNYPHYTDNYDTSEKGLYKIFNHIVFPSNHGDLISSYYYTYSIKYMDVYIPEYLSINSIYILSGGTRIKLFGKVVSRTLPTYEKLPFPQYIKYIIKLYLY